MKAKYITAGFIAVLSYSATAQNADCRFYKDEVDAIEGTRLIISRSKTYAGLSFPDAWFVSNDGRLHLELPLGGMGAAVISDGDELVFKCANDSLIRLQQSGTKATSYYGVGNWVGEWYANLTRRELQKFADWQVIMIRIYYDGTHLDYPVRRKGAEAIRQAAACLLK